MYHPVETFGTNLTPYTEKISGVSISAVERTSPPSPGNQGLMNAPDEMT